MRGAEKGVWAALFEALAQVGGPPTQVLIDSSAVKAHRSAAGGKGGEKSGDRLLARWAHNKIHALTDARCRPLTFMITGGNVADCIAGAALPERLSDCEILHGDKGYDANAICLQVEERGAMPNIPPKANRKWKSCFSPFLLHRGDRQLQVMSLGPNSCADQHRKALISMIVDPPTSTAIADEAGLAMVFTGHRHFRH